MSWSTRVRVESQEWSSHFESLDYKLVNLTPILKFAPKLNLKPNVEFALHHQHETSRGSEKQTKEDFNYFKNKSRKRPRSLSMFSLNSNDWKGYWNTKVTPQDGLKILKEWSWNKTTTKNFPSTRTLQCVFILNHCVFILRM